MFSHVGDVDCILLRGMGHEHDIQTLKDPLPQQVNLASSGLFCRGPQNSHLPIQPHNYTLHKNSAGFYSVDGAYHLKAVLNTVIYNY